MLDEVKNKPRLREMAGQLQSQGSVKLSIGEHIIDTEKFVLTLDTKVTPRIITLWTSKQGIVFAMEDSQFAPGFQILLTQYKRYAEF